MRSPAIAAVEYTVYVGVTTTRGKPASTVPLRFDRQESISAGAADVAFAVGTGVGTFTLTGQIAFTLNIKAEAQKSVRSEDYGTLPSEQEGAQRYRSTDLPVYGIGRSFETFEWVLPMTVGWGETSGCATLWGCSMVHRGKNIVNGSKKTQFFPVMRALCALCPCCVRVVHKRPPSVAPSVTLCHIRGGVEYWVWGFCALWHDSSFCISALRTVMGT